MNTNYKIITLTGPSGSGKTTLAKEILKDSDYKLITSTTTRDPRPTDLEGEYEHILTSAFALNEAEKTFLWSVNYANKLYGTRKLYLNSALEHDHTSIALLVPDTVKILYRHLKQQNKQNLLLPIYINGLDEQTLRQRIQDRAGTTNNLKKRLATIEEWNTQARYENEVPYKFITNNTTIQEALEQIFDYMKN
jgi:guanylate kinase